MASPSSPTDQPDGLCGEESASFPQAEVISPVSHRRPKMTVQLKEKDTVPPRSKVTYFHDKSKGDVEPSEPADEETAEGENKIEEDTNREMKFSVGAELFLEDENKDWKPIGRGQFQNLFDKESKNDQLEMKKDRDSMLFAKHLINKARQLALERLMEQLIDYLLPMEFVVKFENKETANNFQDEKAQMPEVETYPARKGKDKKEEEKESKKEKDKNGQHLRKSINPCVLFCCALLGLIIPAPTVAATVCPENRTAELGGRGVISCNFPDSFSAVYWFSSNPNRSHIMIQLEVEGGVKSGPGFDSGEYDVDQNGSLIIENVTMQHERVYPVAVYTDFPYGTFHISLKVIASPSNWLPTFLCHNCHQEFYYSVKAGNFPSCSFSAARPPVQLEWFELSSEGHEHVEMQQFRSTENRNGTYSSAATFHSLKDSSHLVHLLVCVSTWPLSDWRREKEILLDFSSNASFSDAIPKLQYMEVNRYAKIQCEQSASVYVVWKRILSIGEPDIIGFHSQAMTETIGNIPDVVVSADGSLVFSSPQIHHEGIYACIHGDGQSEEIMMTSVQILVPPSPPYIQIIGCDEVSQSCVFKEDNTKKLTCAVYGVHPTHTLEWKADNEDKISFFNHNTVIRKSGETTDIILSAEYEVSQDVLCGEDILIRCHLLGPLSKIMKTESRAFVKPASCKENVVKGGLSTEVWILVIMLVVCISTLLLVLTRLHRMKSTDSRKPAYNGVSTDEPEENQDPEKHTCTLVPLNGTAHPIKDTGEVIL